MLPSKSSFDSTVESILSKSEYAHLKNSIRDFIDRVRKSISDRIMKMLENSFDNSMENFRISNTISIVFMIIGIIAIAAIVITIVIKINNTFEKKARIKEILGEEITNTTTPLSLRNRASKFQEEGKIREAIRYEFIGILLLMHRKNVIYLEQTQTNEEIYRYLYKNKLINWRQFKTLADYFNYYWYGHKYCDEDVYKKWNEILQQLWNEVMEYEKKGK